MSVYFIRHGHLVKIGYSSNLGARAARIMGEIAGSPEFVGHMPGDRELEAHLHRVFAADRFAGEWFVESEKIRSFEFVLAPDLPQRNDPLQDFNRRREAKTAAAEMMERIRRIASRRWPDANHKDRMCRLRAELGWSMRRVRSLYAGEESSTIRQIEADQIAELELETIGGD